jgi:hypothetical protein
MDPDGDISRPDCDVRPKDDGPGPRAAAWSTWTPTLIVGTSADTTDDARRKRREKGAPARLTSGIDGEGQRRYSPCSAVNPHRPP